MTKIYRWQTNLKYGNMFLQNLRYYEANDEYTRALNYKNTPQNARVKAHLRRIITNFHLKGKNYIEKIRFDEKAIPISDYSFESYYLNVLRLDQSGEYDAAFEFIEELIPHYKKQLDELIIHLSEELKVIYKIHHY